ncbi:phospholipase D/nuclease [Rhizoclosmatium globosum]|uniref:Phospholipase D/nuclease n=1 Tax=Rhizoclosmatium globosum TaxID=329046 RepID=A0A1Y2D1V9_9FUNG|nr:phospholipase D/nuclease [Rhizoclosmatium globosum]|eukprot:ORY53262.1 phospholipase D/nuclease [Rhizoclosmatium globosum]
MSKRPHEILHRLNSGLHLTALSDLAPTHPSNANCHSLRSLLSLRPSVSITKSSDPLFLVYQFNYLLDPAFFFQNLPTTSSTATTPSEITFVVHPNPSIQKAFQEISPRPRNTVKFIHPSLPEPYGTHHTKMMVGRIVASAPGRWKMGSKGAEGGDPLVRWGHMRLGDVLGKDLGREGAERCGTVLCQYSSMGSLGTDDKWLVGEFGGSLWRTGGGSGGGFFQSRVGGGTKKMALVFPTSTNVRDSLQGWAAGDSIPFANQNWEKQKSYLRPLLKKWAGTQAERDNAMPHIKTFTRLNEDSKEVAWILVSSHNVSKAAWGALEKNRTQIHIRSYELGIVLCPEYFKTSKTQTAKFRAVTAKEYRELLPDLVTPQEFVERGGREDEDAEIEIPIWLPYDLPLTPYSASDEPWRWDVAFEGTNNQVDGQPWKKNGATSDDASSLTSSPGPTVPSTPAPAQATASSGAHSSVAPHFGDLLSAGLRGTIAGFKNAESKDLEVFIKEERDVVDATGKKMRQFAGATTAFQRWAGTKEEDIRSIAAKWVQIQEDSLHAEKEYTDALEQSRARMKVIRNREKAIGDAKGDLKKAINARDAAQKKQAPADDLIQRARNIQTHIRQLEAEHLGLTRLDLREALRIKHEAAIKYAVKMSVASKFSLYLADQIPQGTLHPGQDLPPFQNHSTLEQIMADFKDAFGSNELVTVVRTEVAGPAFVPTVPERAPSPSLSVGSYPDGPSSPAATVYASSRPAEYNNVSALTTQVTNLQVQDSRSPSPYTPPPIQPSVPQQPYASPQPQYATTPIPPASSSTYTPGYYAQYLPQQPAPPPNQPYYQQNQPPLRQDSYQPTAQPQQQSYIAQGYTPVVYPGPPGSQQYAYASSPTYQQGPPPVPPHEQQYVPGQQQQQPQRIYPGPPPPPGPPAGPPPDYPNAQW